MSLRKPVLSKVEGKVGIPSGHDWLPTDTQGYSMECGKCGEYISISDDKRWNRSIDAKCKGNGSRPGSILGKIKLHFAVVLTRLKSWARRRGYSARGDIVSKICRFFIVDSIVKACFAAESEYERTVEVENENLRMEMDLLQKTLTASEEKVSDLQMKANRHWHELDRKQDTILAKVAMVLNADMFTAAEDPPDNGNWAIMELDDEPGFHLVTGYCMLGGCELRYVTFNSRPAALLYGAVLDALGVKATSNTACSECYQEYMKDCI